jgi:hypothetical protein
VIPSYPDEFFDFNSLIILIISSSETGLMFISGKPFGKCVCKYDIAV